MTMTGGGHSPRVRTALLILAMAIQADNEEEENKYKEIENAKS